MRRQLACTIAGSWCSHKLVSLECISYLHSIIFLHSS